MNHILPETVSVDFIKSVTAEEIAKQNKRNDLTITRSYRNGLGYSVDIIDRNNVVFTIPKSNTGFEVTNELTIVETIVLAEGVNINVDSLLTEAENSAIINAYKTSIQRRKDLQVKFTTTSNQIMIEYAINANQLARYRHRIYFPELDMTICRSGTDYTVVHPYSLIGQSLIVQSQLNSQGFNYTVIINDPDYQHGKRYINISNRVFEVEITRDHSMKPGVYIFTKGSCLSAEDYGKVNSQYFFDFKEADEKVPLWKTASLAKDFGDAHLSRTEELKIRESEIKQAKAELELQKTMLESDLKTIEADYKREQYERDSKMKRLEDELHREKLERERLQARLKHEQDMMSLNRKDASDFMKWLPGIVNAIVGIVNIALAVKGSKPIV